MANHTNRGKVTVTPLDSVYRRHLNSVLSKSLPHGWTAEALVSDGLLSRCKNSGNLAIWQGDRMVSVDARKAEAALQALHETTDE